MSYADDRHAHPDQLLKMLFSDKRDFKMCSSIKISPLIIWLQNSIFSSMCIQLKKKKRSYHGEMRTRNLQIWSSFFYWLRYEPVKEIVHTFLHRLSHSTASIYNYFLCTSTLFLIRCNLSLSECHLWEKKIYCWVLQEPTVFRYDLWCSTSYTWYYTSIRGDISPREFLLSSISI